MKKRLLFLLAMAFAVIAVPVIETGCAAHVVSIESGGVYTDAYLATTDQAILDAAHTLDGFLDWYNANATFLAKYPAVVDLAANVNAHKNDWIRNAYAARDAYASASAAYKAGKAGAPGNASVAAALAVLSDITKQITAYKAAHA